MREFDVAVIGAGVAGLTAAATAARHGVRVIVVDSLGAGGQVMTVERIENFPGSAEPVAGYELGPTLQEQAELAGAEFLLDEVQSIATDGPMPVITCAGEQVAARTVIIAAGSSRRPLDIPGEEALKGRGVSHCASCDGPLYKGMTVAIIGGGDSAFDEARMIANHAGQVLIIHRNYTLRAAKPLVHKVAALGNVKIHLNTTIEEIIGTTVVTAISLRDQTTGQSRIEPTDGVFVYVGLEPNTGFLQGQLALSDDRRIVTDRSMQTSVPGIFAAGDIRHGSVALLAEVAGDGATAAMAALRHLDTAMASLHAAE
jgi:thioredoxin reductase (NADPH)